MEAFAEDAERIPDNQSNRSINISYENINISGLSNAEPHDATTVPNTLNKPSKSINHSSNQNFRPQAAQTSSTSRPTMLGAGIAQIGAIIPRDNADPSILNNIEVAESGEESEEDENLRNRTIRQRLENIAQPGIVRRALQSICGEKRDHSPEQQRKPRGKGKKTKYSESRSANILREKTIDSMNKNQRRFFDEANEQLSTAHENLKAQELDITALREQNQYLIAAQTSFKEKERANAERTAYLEGQVQLLQKQNKEEIQKNYILEAENKKLRQQTSILPRLRRSFADESALNRELSAEIARLQQQHFELQTYNAELLQIMDAMEQCTKAALQKPTEKSNAAKITHNPPPPKLLEEYQPRTQRYHVAKAVNELESDPLKMNKVMARLVPKVDDKKPKMNAMQALAAAVLLDFNQNQIEKLKTLLRILNLDILPPITTIRALIKSIRQEYEYLNFHDEERKIYVRVAVSIKEIIKLRVERWLETGKFVFIEGYDKCAFFGIGGDQGGNSKKYVLNLLNVPKGHSSPNNSAVFGVAVAPKDDYETTKYCFQEKFDEINLLDGKEMEFAYGDTTITLTVYFFVSLDGKECSILSGHSGASSSCPCPTCECTRKQINEGQSGPLRDAARMMEQAAMFHQKKEALSKLSEKISEKKLTDLRKETTCIVNKPICTITKKQWIYGALHSIGGPVTDVLDELEDKALKDDLDEMKISVLQKKEIRKKSNELQKEITLINSYIAEIQNAIKLAKIVKPKWIRLSKNPPAKSDDDCGAKYCVMGNLKDNSTQSLYLKCNNCNNYVHASCDLIFISHEIKYAEEEEYLCHICDPTTDKKALEDLDYRIQEWQTDMEKLKQIITEKEQQKAEVNSNVVIPYEKCLRYQRIQEKLKELKIRKSCHPFQALQGVDVRKLVKNAESFVQALEEQWQEPAKTFLDCMNVYQELAEPKMLTEEDIARIDEQAALRSYREICGNEIPLKMHDLTTHTPDFIKLWKFYQLASDQPVEHVHHIAIKLKTINTHCKKSAEAELEAFTNAMSIRNKLFDLGISTGNFDGRLIEEKRKMFESLKEE